MKARRKRWEYVLLVLTCFTFVALASCHVEHRQQIPNKIDNGAIRHSARTVHDAL